MAGVEAAVEAVALAERVVQNKHEKAAARLVVEVVGDVHP